MPARALGRVVLVASLWAVSCSAVLSKNNVTLVPIDFSPDGSYTINIGIGTPSQKFRVTFDTGSGNLWVPDVTCRDGCQGKARFNSAKSSTYQSSGEKQDLVYGAGYADVVQAEDVITLAGLKFVLPISLVTNLVTANIPGQIQEWDGLMGSGLPGSGQGGVPVPLQAMAEQGQLPSPVFGLYLNGSLMWGSDSAPEPGWGGELAVGGPNPARMGSELAWVDVVTADEAHASVADLWLVPLESVTVQHSAGAKGKAARSISVCRDSHYACVAVLDSGTSEIVGPMEQVAALNKALGGAPNGELSMPCPDTIASLVDLLKQQVVDAGYAFDSLQMSEACQSLTSDLQGLETQLCSALSNAVLEGLSDLPDSPSLQQFKRVFTTAAKKVDALCADLPYMNADFDCNMQPLAGPNVTFGLAGHNFTLAPFQWLVSNGDGSCTSVLSGSGMMDDGTWIVGDVLISNMYVVFDYGNTVKPGSSAGAGRRLHSGGAAGAASHRPRVGLAALPPSLALPGFETSLAPSSPGEVRAQEADQDAIATVGAAAPGQLDDGGGPSSVATAAVPFPAAANLTATPDRPAATPAPPTPSAAPLTITSSSASPPPANQGGHRGLSLWLLAACFCTVLIPAGLV